MQGLLDSLRDMGLQICNLLPGADAEDQAKSDVQADVDPLVQGDAPSSSSQ